MYSLVEIEELLKKGPKIKLVFPEGDESKIQAVATKLIDKNLVEPWLIFENEAQLPKNFDARIKTLFMSKLDIKPFVEKFMDLRGSKTNLEQAQSVMKNRAYIGAMLVDEQKLDGMVCGLTFTTADTLRPTLQIIKTQPNIKLASSIMILRRQKEAYFMADCALNIDPQPSQLAEIAKLSAQFACSLGLKKPEVVLLSYSTKGSGFGPQVDKIQEAVKLLKSEKQNFVFDGEMQFDAAFDRNVRLKKSPNTELKKSHPDVYIFPDLQSGNIGYKIAQRLGNFEAAGPFILGLNHPVNDLSRGATLNDIYETAVITAFQAKVQKESANDVINC